MKNRRVYTLIVNLDCKHVLSNEGFFSLNVFFTISLKLPFKTMFNKQHEKLGSILIQQKC